MRNKYNFSCEFFVRSLAVSFLLDEEHLLELRMKISGGRRLSLPSPDPADSPMVRCATGKVAQKAAKVINDAKKRSEQKNS